MEPQQILARYKPDIEAELRRVVGDSPLLLYDMMRYHLGWIDPSGNPKKADSGKLLRPTLCLLACEAVGGQYEKALPSAAAIELVHNFSLIHDDIEDASPERRHRPTVWSIWGEAQAINAGDCMHAMARGAVLKLEQREVAPDKVLRAARILDDACIKLCEGQYQDISFEDRLDIKVYDYFTMIQAKTATLIGSSLEIGAMLGTDDEPVIASLKDFGHKLGIAFQIKDDILGIWGREERTGKPSAGDIRQRKKTLPIVYALEKAPDPVKDALCQIYSKKSLSDRDVSDVIKILDSSGALGYCKSLAEKYYHEAIYELDTAAILPGPRQQLKILAAFIMEREY